MIISRGSNTFQYFDIYQVKMQNYSSDLHIEMIQNALPYFLVTSKSRWNKVRYQFEIIEDILKL